MAEQYSAKDKDNVAVSPQPGDVEITDIYGNIFDNFNEYGVVDSSIKDTPQNRLVAFYNKDNVLLNPQPAYQNLNYKRYLKNNTLDPTQPLPDAKDYVFSGDIPGTTRTPEPYQRSDKNNNVVSTLPAGALTVTLRVEESEGLIVTEDDVSGIRLEVNHLEYASVRNFG